MAKGEAGNKGRGQDCEDSSISYFSFISKSINVMK